MVLLRNKIQFALIVAVEYHCPCASLHPSHPRFSSLLLVSHGLWCIMSFLSKEDKHLSKTASGLPDQQYVTRLLHVYPGGARSPISRLNASYEFTVYGRIRRQSFDLHLTLDVVFTI